MLAFLHEARAPMTLPLFPLRTVLFPGGLLPIKIFEQRYIDMAKACLADDKPFGVCLLTQGDEVASDGGRQDFAMIGTLARIVRWDMPQLGILHVTAEGGSRYQVQRHHVESNHLAVAEVTTLAPEPAVAMSDDSLPLARLLELIAGKIGAANFPVEPRYDDGSWVGYRLAEVLPLPLHIKQTMLEINDAGVRLKVLREFLVQQQLI
ncbi:MAG: LON peptidase substrate-binding domain-containing protein [Betaproteobacteria bacterium]